MWKQDIEKYSPSRAIKFSMGKGWLGIDLGVWRFALKP
jgi:hypothetical protein